MIPQYLAHLSPFALTPALIAVGICPFARIRKWPTWPFIDLPQRSKDGLALGLLCLVAHLAARYLHQLVGTAFGVQSWHRSDLQFYLFQATFFTIGFVIGSIVVGDVRKIAYSEIVPTASGRSSLLASKVQPV